MDMLLGVFGGLGKKTTSRGFNRATQGIRQTGSACLLYTSDAADEQ